VDLESEENLLEAEGAVFGVDTIYSPEDLLSKVTSELCCVRMEVRYFDLKCEGCVLPCAHGYRSFMTICINSGLCRYLDIPHNSHQRYKSQEQALFRTKVES